MLNIQALDRDPEAVRSALRTTKGNTVVAKKPCAVYIPSWFEDKQLAFIGSDARVLGIFALVVENTQYAVSLATSMIRLNPTSVNRITVDDSEYYEFLFEPGDTVIANTELVVSDTMPYYINDEIIGRGRVPWYLDYEDLGSLFENTKHFNGYSLGGTDAVLEMIATSIARSPEDPKVYYRQFIKSKKDLKTRPPRFIAFRNISYGATNTTAKLMGSYFETSLTSALVNPSEKVEDIEELLRR